MSSNLTFGTTRTATRTATEDKEVSREKKVLIYEEFNELMFRALMWDKAGLKKPSEQDLQREFIDF